jgi:hypothetical protein
MPDEPDDDTMREMRERLRRRVVLRQLTEDERNARDQALAEAKVTQRRRRRLPSGNWCRLGAT